VYHRQIYKHFLTNKILKDPQQRRIFKARDMKDLFTLKEDTSADNKTETAALFGDVDDLVAGDQATRTSEEIVASENTRRVGKASDRRSLEDGELSPDKADPKGKRSVEDGDENNPEEESRILKNLFEANGIHVSIC
jgi:DNA excision repair protein ERCC-6